MKGAVGKLKIVFRKRQDGRTALAEQYFKLPLQILPAHYQDEDGTAFVYMLNPSGGILQHDLLITDITVEKDARAYVTTPSANKFYRMDDGFATIENRLEVAEGGVLEYMPEHNVPFAESKTFQVTEIFLKRDSTLIFNDMFTSGRLARGESFDYHIYSSKMKIFVEDKLLAYDNMKIEPSKEDFGGIGGIGIYETYNILSTFYIYSEKISENLREELMKIIESFSCIRGGVSKVDESLLIIRILGKSVIDMQDVIKEVWNETRKKLLNKEAVRVRKY